VFLEVEMQYYIEIFGTMASVIVAISLMMRNIKWLRILNGIGSAAFVIYGIFIGALPVWLLNAFIVIINIYYLVKMRLTRDRFDIIERPIHESPYIDLFLKFYKNDIELFFPQFKLDDVDGLHADLILRDMNPVSLILYKTIKEHETEIVLDYAVPNYRDFKNAQYYFNAIRKRIASEGTHVFVARAYTKPHAKYLKKLGFLYDKTEAGCDVYRLTVGN